MRVISIGFLFAVAASGQTDFFGAGSVTLSSGVIVNIKTAIEPPVKKSSFLPLGVGYRSDGNAMRFHICDNATRTCVGFRLEVASAEASGARMVTFGQDGPGGSAISETITGEPAFKEAPLAKYPPPQKIRDGDTIVLDLMVSADGKESVVEYLTFDFGSTYRIFGGRIQTVRRFNFKRDFTLDDGPVVVSKQPFVGVSVNSVDVPVISQIRDDSKGATLWVYFPGHGRYILSLSPHEGFVQAGTVNGQRTLFSADGQNYEVWLGKPLIAAEGPWNLYVLHEPQFVPPGTKPSFAVVSVDRLENLLPKR